MTGDREITEKNTSLYYPFFQNMFDLADMTSSAWQPALKAIGRTHLEFAGLQARQTRALVHWMHQLSRPVTPADVFNANAQLWASMIEDCLDTAPRVAAAVETAAEAVAPELPETPLKQPRDTLILLDRDDEIVPERRVA